MRLVLGLLFVMASLRPAAACQPADGVSADDDCFRDGVIARHPVLGATWAPTRFVHGGPLLLLGVSSGEGQSFRLRGGWEAAIGQPWLVFAITGDTDARTTWTLAATAEATSRAWVLPLSLGAGGGAVLADGHRPGGRGQLSLALGPARLAFSLDVLAASGGGIGTAFAALLGGSL